MSRTPSQTRQSPETSERGSRSDRIRDRLRFGRVDLDPQERRQVLDQLFYFTGDRFRPYLRRFSFLLAASVAIASFGLLTDSGAVVIGAMLVAPLMTPILAIAASMVMGWSSRQIKSMLLVLAASAGSIALAWLLGHLEPDRVILTSQIMDRTRPELLDLGIALAAGSAGAYVLVRRESSAIPGVAIAVALVPPLAVVGLTLEEGEVGLALGALLLFATNLVAIILAASIVFLITGFTPRTVAQRAGRKITWGIVSALIGVVLVAIPLTIHSEEIIREARQHHETERHVEQWAGPTSLEVLEIHIDEEEVIVEVAGPDPPPDAEPLADALADDFDDVAVTVRWTERMEETIER